MIRGLTTKGFIFVVKLFFDRMYPHYNVTTSIKKLEAMNF